MNSEDKWFKKELARVETIKKGLHDQYNSLDNPIDKYDVDKLIRNDHQYSPTCGQTWESYLGDLKIYAKFCYETNVRTHVNGPKGAWYTHRNPMGCFACEDLNLIYSIINAMEIMVKQYPKTLF